MIVVIPNPIIFVVEKKMDSLTVEKMSEVLWLASDKTRLRILLCLLSSDDGLVEKSVNQISLELNISQSLTSHQLKVLKDAKLIAFRKEGRTVYYRLDDEHVNKLIEVVREHVEEAR